MTGEAWLEARSLTKTFGGVTAIGDADLSLSAGEVRGIVGPNGAGKSTLMQMLAGIHSVDEGELLIDGKSVKFRAPDDALNAGIALVPQEMQLGPHLTVAANIVLGREPRRFGILSESGSKTIAMRALKRLDTPIDPDAPIHTLTTVEKRLVMVARALVGNARLIILDEPTAALAPHEAEAILSMVRALSAAGVTFLYVSHRFDDIELIADTVTGVRDAAVIADLTRKEIDRDSLVSLVTPVNQLSTAAAPKPVSDSTREGTTLTIDSLVASQLRGVSFDVAPGQIVGVAGLAGSGADELLWAVGGIDPWASGNVRLGEKDLRSGDRVHATKAGVAYVPGDRTLATFPSHDVASNISIADLESISTAGVPRHKREWARARGLAERVSLLAPLDATLSSLSGGNQQKAIFARWMATDVCVMLLHDPTAGVDVAARTEIHQRVREFAAAGTAVLLVTTDIPELVELSDRVVVLDRGVLVETLDGDAVTQPAVLAAMTSGLTATGDFT